MLLRLSYGLATYGSFRWIGGAWGSETLNKDEPAWNNIIQIFIFRRVYDFVELNEGTVWFLLRSAGEPFSLGP